MRERENIRSERENKIKRDGRDYIRREREESGYAMERWLSEIDNS